MFVNVLRLTAFMLLAASEAHQAKVNLQETFNQVAMILEHIDFKVIDPEVIVFATYPQMLQSFEYDDVSPECLEEGNKVIDTFKNMRGESPPLVEMIKEQHMFIFKKSICETISHDCFFQYFRGATNLFHKDEVVQGFRKQARALGKEKDIIEMFFSVPRLYTRICEGRGQETKDEL